MSDQSSAQTQVSPPSPLTLEGDVRFRSSKLLTIARIGWLIIISINVAMSILSYPIWYESQIVKMIPANAAAIGAIGISPRAYSTYVIIFNVLLGVFSLAAAGLLFVRKSDNWMVLVISLGMFLYIGTPPPAFTVVMLQASLPLKAILSTLLLIGDFCMYTVLFLFPDGKFYPRWQRWLFLFGLLWDTLGMYSYYLFTKSWGDFFQGVLLIITIIALYGQVRRYRKVLTAVQQQQTKWILFGIGIGVFSAAINFILEILLKPNIHGSVLGIYYIVSPLLTAYIPLAIILISIVFSMMRYRLWEVDIFINRGLVIGAVSLLLGIIFIAVVALVDGVSKAVSGQQQPGIALIASTLLIGGLYDPMRRRVRHVIDRRLYGLKVDLDKMDLKPRSPAPQNNLPVETPPNWGTYEVKSLIGRGGMGNVYRGRHTTLNREVAIKMLPPSLADDPQTRSRFEQEANIVAGLRHPNIVQVFDFGELNGTNYMVMEFINGVELSRYIKDNAPLPLTQVRSIIDDVAAALDYAHQQGFVHRDIKPANVMLHTATGQRGNGFPYRAILMDFGIARILGSNSTLTNTSMLGTLEYSAPEQILKAKEVTPSADIYALGIMTYQMLTGHLPFEGKNPGVLVFAHLQKPAPDPRSIVPSIPVNVARAVMRAMEKDPEARFASADEFAAALRS